MSQSLNFFRWIFYPGFPVCLGIIPLVLSPVVSALLVLLMSSRSRPRLDYLTFHREGRKVPKEGREGEMDLDKLVFEEKLVVEDINHTLDIYKLDDLLSESEVQEAVGIINDLSSRFRHVHVAISDLDENYDTNYPNHAAFDKEINDFIRSARARVRELRRDVGKSEPAQHAQSGAPDIFTLQAKHSVLKARVDFENDSVDLLTLTSESDINKYVSSMEKFIERYFDLQVEIKCAHPAFIDTDFANDVSADIFEIRQDIKLAKRAGLAVKQAREKLSNANVLDSNVTKFDNLVSELSIRFKTISKRYVTSLDTLSDYQILDLYLDKSEELEFNAILGKVTELSALAPYGGSKSLGLLQKVGKTRDRMVSKRDTFRDSLSSIVRDRDITADKLKQASDLVIELPKFSGYDSAMDFYTFKSEFLKLVAPKIRKQHTADYLKRNYLSGGALKLVENETDHELIWSRLKESFGNTRFLLQNKLSSIDKFGNLSQCKNNLSKLSSALTGLVNTMQDLTTLAKKHDLEGQLYEGGGLEKFLSLLGEARHRRFRAENLTVDFSKKQEWQKLNEFLKKELKLTEKLILDRKSAELLGISSTKKDSNKNNHPPQSALNVMTKILCHICGKDGHTTVTTARGNVIVPYYVCEKFVNWSIKERLDGLKSKNLCTICLFPGASTGGRHKCTYTNFCCPSPSHDRSSKIHVLLCEQHKDDDQNKKLLLKYKERFILKCPVTLPSFCQNLSLFSGLVCHGRDAQVKITFGLPNEVSDIKCRAIFLRQEISVGGVKLSILFDNGCGKSVLKKSAIDKLKAIGRARQTVPGPLELIGVGDKRTLSDYGEYAICIPMASGEQVILSGICLVKITSSFPGYSLKSVEDDIRNRCQLIGGDKLVSSLPELPSVLEGGDIDIIIGSQYMRYFPKTVFELDTGLRILESKFVSTDGTRGALNGPHEFFESEGNGDNSLTSYYLEDARVVRAMPSEMPLVSAKHFSPSELEDDDLGLSCGGCACRSHCANIVCAAKRAPANAKRFEDIEHAGSEVTFRCVDCRSCQKCKNGPTAEAMSLQEELEQSMIEKCVHVDTEAARTVARLPFLFDPLTHLERSNEHVANRVFKSQLNVLNANESDKRSVLEFEGKLQAAGYVDYVKNLSEEMRNLIFGSPVLYFIPWRPAYKQDSVSTPCRMVFDATMSSKGACSLNSLLAKGANSLNNLQSIIIRWSTRAHAFHTDVQKMYNRVLLSEAHWCYQLYLFSENLDLGDSPEWKVIKTLIYGVRPSGELAQCALRRTVEMCKEEFPLAYRPISDDTYMDDCASGTESASASNKVMDEIQVALAKGGFSLKGFTTSGSPPLAELSHDGESVTVLGLKWFSEGDFFRLNIGELNFSRKQRGRKVLDNSGKIPDILTLRNCVSRASEIFDPVGRAAPIVGGLKLDISTLHKQCVGWDDPIPTGLKEVWISNFQTISDLANVNFRRAVVPPDALNLEVELICLGDAGENMVCSAIYARFLRRDGSHSCQLIFARTKVIHDHTIPRGELAAAVLNASSSHIVKTSLGEMHKRSWHVTDSQVCLYILNSQKATLKTWIRNRVIEVSRLSDLSDWVHTKRENMIADLGTRKGARVDQIGPNSEWICGKPWMRGCPSDFPFSSVDDIKLSAREKSEAAKEKVVDVDAESTFCAITHVPKEVEDRYKFSQYLINPNRFNFRTVVRILSFVFLFIQMLVKSKPGIRSKLSFLDVDKPTESDQYIVFPFSATIARKKVTTAVIKAPRDLLTAASNYFFRKAALEVQKFVDPNRYKNISVCKDGILYFTGRILMTQKIDGDFSFTDAMLDLSESTFCVPITDSLSPVAYAIMTDTHWNDPDVRHKGIETTLRYAQKTAYVLGGRDLAKRIKKACAKCRILHLKGVEVAMGPVADENLKIAPAFFMSQVDICGPFKAFSPANTRAKLNIWIVVFVCTVTSAVDCRVMQNYDTESFIFAYNRFACRFGHPKVLMPDAGSQLVRGCKDMVISFTDLAMPLSQECGVDFKTCPVGAHFVHGRVERKIQQIKQSLACTIMGKKISTLQWETLALQVANVINNLPIGLGNKTEDVEHLDVLTPNRLLLGRNNCRNPTAPVELSGDLKKIVKSNAEIFEIWFKEWLISYVPTLVQQPKWFDTERSVTVGDVVLFKKSDKEFEKNYQYGIIVKTVEGRDGLVRNVTVEYQNSSEATKRTTNRHARDIVVIHPVDEIGIAAELSSFAEAAQDLL